MSVWIWNDWLLVGSNEIAAMFLCRGYIMPGNASMLDWKHWPKWHAVEAFACGKAIRRTRIACAYQRARVLVDVARLCVCGSVHRRMLWHCRTVQRVRAEGDEKMWKTSKTTPSTAYTCATHIVKHYGNFVVSSGGWRRASKKHTRVTLCKTQRRILAICVVTHVCS